MTDDGTIVDWLLWIFALAGFSLVCAFAARRNVRKVRAIRQTPTSDIASAPATYVELHGIGRPADGEQVIAPYSGEPCCWYRYREEEYVDGLGSNRSSWKTVDQGESHAPFLLVDGTGHVQLSPRLADITAERKHRERDSIFFSGTSKIKRVVEPPKEELKWTASNLVSALTTRSRSNTNRRRVTEWRIDIGEPIVALGLLTSAARRTEQDVAALLREWKQDQTGLMARFDLNKDGKIGEQEWMLARAQARREVEKARLAKSSAPHAPPPAPPVGMKELGPAHDDTKPFLISTHSADHLVFRHGAFATLSMLGCLLFGIAAVWLIIAPLF